MALAAVKKDQPKQKDAEPAAAAKPAKKSKVLWIVLGASLLLIPAIGGGVYWYLHKNSADEAKAEVPKPPVYVALETFTVNLQIEEVPQFLQVGLSLRVADNAVVDSVKLHMPEIRNTILLLLSSQKASELVTLPGKNKLSIDIVAAVNRILAPAPTRAAKPAPKPAPKPAAEAAEGGEAAEPEAAADKEGEDAAEKPAPKPAKKKAPVEPASAAPVMSVLFTSFIVQ